MRRLSHSASTIDPARLPSCDPCSAPGRGTPPARRRRRLGSAWTALLVLLANPGWAIPSKTGAADARRVPRPVALPAAEAAGPPARSGLEALPPVLQAALSGTLGAERPDYHATESPERVRLRNEANGFTADFTRAGLELRQGGARLQLALARMGRGDRLEPVSVASPTAGANRVEFRRGPVTEWYANGPLGLEQGFTLTHSPGRPDDGRLSLVFALAGNFDASVEPGGRGLALAHEGRLALRYGGLLAFDATGRELPAALVLAEGGLRLSVDDAGAVYPLTIDPVIGATRLNNNQSVCTIGQLCQAGSPGDRFGQSVAISSDGNTVAVAAPYGFGSNLDSGAVYVFRKPSGPFGGWNGCITIGCLDSVAKLTSTPGLNQHGFGTSVAISGDGNTIAVLTDTLDSVDSSAGIVYVYVKPTSGWTSTGQHAAILSLTTLTETPCGFSGNATDCQTDATSSIAVNGDGSTIVLGYTGALVGGESRGAAYVFVRPAGGWNDSASPVKLTRASGGHRDLLGMAVAISADDGTIVATAPQANGYAGVVDLFLKSGSWTSATQSAELTAAPGSGLGFVGNSVDTTASGTTVAVGASGRVLVFPQPRIQLCTPRGCVSLPLWVDSSDYAELSTSDGASIARPRISADGTRIIASDFGSPGSVYAFLRPPTGWDDATEGARFGAPDAAPGDQFGYSTLPGTSAIGMSSNGSVVLVGAPGATTGINPEQGAAYVFLPEPQGMAACGAAVLAAAGLARRRRGEWRSIGNPV
ncbi:MAG: FG-GAP repeat protein [Myxococcota bacterium]